MKRAPLKTKNKIIGLNGSFLYQPDTGIGQVTRSFLENLNQIELPSNWKFVVYLYKDLSPKIKMRLKNKKISFRIVSGWYRRDDLLKRLLWEKYWLPKQANLDGCHSFFSLYQSASVFPSYIKHLILVHDVVPKRFPIYLNNIRKKIYYRAVDWAITRADKILTISDFSRREIGDVYGISPKKIIVNHIACNTVFYRKLSQKVVNQKLSKYGINSADKFIFYIGGFDVRKNVGNLIKAYGALVNKYPDSPQLVLAGQFHSHLVPLVTDIKEEINKSIHRYHLDKKKYRLTGFIPEDDLPAFYQAATAFVYPSLYEGFGLPVLEAMASRCPVVTSNLASIPEVISSKAGWLISNPQNYLEIKNKIKEVLFSSSLEIIQNKLNLAYRESKKFSWSDFTKKVLQLIAQE